MAGCPTWRHRTLRKPSLSTAWCGLPGSASSQSTRPSDRQPLVYLLSTCHVAGQVPAIVSTPTSGVGPLSQWLVGFPRHRVPMLQISGISVRAVSDVLSEHLTESHIFLQAKLDWLTWTLHAERDGFSFLVHGFRGLGVQDNSRACARILSLSC